MKIVGHKMRPDPCPKYFSPYCTVRYFLMESSHIVAAIKVLYETGYLCQYER